MNHGKVQREIPLSLLRFYFRRSLINVIIYILSCLSKSAKFNCDQVALQFYFTLFKVRKVQFGKAVVK